MARVSAPIAPVHLAPGLRRLTASNPSPFTYTGTQTYLVGESEIAVIDPGPASTSHIDAILGATDGARISAILITHNHRDHSPAAGPLAKATGAPVMGCAPLTPSNYGGDGLDAAFDALYSPDRVLADGDAVTGTGWTLQVIATPGHTSNHLAFAWAEAQALFSGDHVMGWSTTVVIPPDGDMGAYLASLESLLGRDDTVYYPGHGDPIEQPARMVRSLIGHRRQREGQILRLLGSGDQALPDLVGAMYVGLDPQLVPAARASVLAHLIDLQRRGLAAAAGADWRLAA